MGQDEEARSSSRLAGVQVLLTRALRDSQVLGDILAAHGAEVSLLPAIGIEPPEDFDPLDRALFDLASYDWIAFASRNAVRATLGRLSALGLSLPPGLAVAAVGRSTAAELSNAGIEVACVPEVETAEGMVTAMEQRGVAGVRVLLPAGDRSRPDLRRRLEAAGARVDAVIAYRTAIPANADTALLEAVRRGEMDVIVLASPSAVENLQTLLAAPEPLVRAKLVCIGPTTAAAARVLGFEPAAVASHPSADGLADAILSLYPEHAHD